jgi:RNA ligase
MEMKTQQWYYEGSTQLEPFLREAREDGYRGRIICPNCNEANGSLLNLKCDKCAAQDSTMRLFTQLFLRGAAMVEGPNGVVPGPDPLIGLAQLTATLGIHCKQHPKYPELYHFSYDQLESPKGNPIVRECRGLILNSTDNWAVVAYPFNRFANLGESWADPIDWSDVRVQEKVDGSMMIFWNYKGDWNVSTKGSPDAGGQVGDFNFTFSDLFWKTLKTYLNGDSTMGWFDPKQTYVFELTSIYNRVVVQHKETALTVIGLRSNLGDYKEYPVSNILDGLDPKFPIPLVKEFPLNSVSEIEAAALALNPMQNEGFVVVDKNFGRVKIKSPSYVMIHHLKDGFGQRRIIRLIQLGETSEVLSYFPEYQELFDQTKTAIDNMIATTEAEYEAIKHLKDRKEFALQATKSKNSGVLFALFLGKTTSVRDYILHSKKIVNKTTGEEDFAFPADKIEAMAGLRTRPEVTVE